MPLSKPFYRIIRPFTDGAYIPNDKDDDEVYILSSDYASDRATLIRAYAIIERDLVEMFNYIEPADDNLRIYSHKTYELLLRASTEFETNCKAILNANGYKAGGNNLAIQDYHKIDKASKLREYKITLDTWLPSQKVFQPFKDWSNGNPLRWYQSYNAVKHDRSTKFQEASLENVMASVTGLLSILVSQFYVFAFNPYQSVEAFTEGDDGSLYTETSLFKVMLPTNWSQDEQYNFDWNVIRAGTTPFDRFSF